MHLAVAIVLGKDDCGFAKSPKVMMITGMITIISMITVNDCYGHGHDHDHDHVHQHVDDGDIVVDEDAGYEDGDAGDDVDGDGDGGVDVW